MRVVPLLSLVLAIVLSGCQGKTTTTPEPTPTGDQTSAAAVTPDDDVHRGLDTRSPMGGSTLNREVHLDTAIRSAWRGVTVRVETTSGELVGRFEAPLTTSTPLGDTGLTLTAELFVPDFVMDEGGITTRSPEPNNPAVRVTIEEAGVEPYNGWLFATMPSIHAYPHERYRVFLEEGIPAD